MIVTLRSDALEADVDPAHGAEVVALRSGGISLLARSPFADAPPLAGELGEEAWTRAYRGGWQLLTPNAGEPCELDGVRHGFHGRASNDPWELLDATPGAARLRWRGHGLTVTRAYALDGAAITATTTWEADERPVPMLHVEHVAVGIALLDPAVEVRFPALRDGSPARTEHWPFERERDVFETHGELAVGEAALVNAARGLTLRLEWDVAQLPALWHWHEVRATEKTWERHGEIVGLEPASTTHAEGLAEAVAAGVATWVQPGEPITRSLTLRVERSA